MIGDLIFTDTLEDKKDKLQEKLKLPNSLIINFIIKTGGKFAEFLLAYLFKNTRKKITELYNKCLSKKEYGEEGFWEIIEGVFIEALEDAEYNRKKPILKLFTPPIDSPSMENVLELLAVTIMPKDLGIEEEEFKSVAREAYHTYLARKKLKENSDFYKTIKNWIRIISEDAVI